MSEKEPGPDIIRTLVRSHDDFRRFLQARLGSREEAEDVLQAAFVKSLERGDEIRSEETAVAWFYRVLRNAVADHFRRRSVENRALDRKAAETPVASIPDSELERMVCRCLGDLIPTLKIEYADILRKVELEGAKVEEVASAEFITPNNAMVRLHRARKALQSRLVQTCGACTEHGCLACTCKKDSFRP